MGANANKSRTESNPSHLILPLVKQRSPDRSAASFPAANRARCESSAAIESALTITGHCPTIPVGPQQSSIRFPFIDTGYHRDPHHGRWKGELLPPAHGVISSHEPQEAKSADRLSRKDKETLKDGPLGGLDPRALYEFAQWLFDNHFTGQSVALWELQIGAGLAQSKDCLVRWGYVHLDG